MVSGCDRPVVPLCRALTLRWRSSVATLLHIDSSVFPTSASASRAVAEAFRSTWEEQHPNGTVIYRDLSAVPAPHLTADAHTAGLSDPSEHTPEQAAAFAERVTFIEELEQADAVLIGAPMYNYTIPSTLKAWLDNVILIGRTAGATPTAKGTPVTVIASRGGSYEPGTPREPYEYVRNYLTAIFADASAWISSSSFRSSPWPRTIRPCRNWSRSTRPLARRLSPTRPSRPRR